MKKCSKCGCFVGNKKHNCEKIWNKMSKTRSKRLKLGLINLSGCAKLSKYNNFSKGKNNPMYGKRRKDLSSYNKKYKKGKTYEEIYGKEKAEKLKKLTSERFAGENNPTFNNWSSFEPYGKDFSTKMKEYIRKLYNYKCVECKLSQKKLKYKLSIHHIDYDKKNNKKENLIPLCRSCHEKTNFNREKWRKYFKNKLYGI